MCVCIYINIYIYSNIRHSINIYDCLKEQSGKTGSSKARQSSIFRFTVMSLKLRAKSKNIIEAE